MLYAVTSHNSYVLYAVTSHNSCMLYAVASHNRYMLASVVKHAADVAMNFNRLISVIQTARVFCEAAAVAFSKLLNMK